MLGLRLWTVEGAIPGETCTDTDDTDSELWCDFLTIPPCEDRSIRCTPSPNPEKANKTFTEKPHPLNDFELGTSIDYYCPDRLHYFDFPVGDDFVSFYYTTNINFINITCNADSLWEVRGDDRLDGLVCDDMNPNDTLVTCKDLYIPDCADRAVYCMAPPTEIDGGEVTILNNPSPVFAKTGKSNHFLRLAWPIK